MENKKKLFIETYGCQMNVADSEVVTAILLQQGYEITNNIPEANLILLNTCSIRDNAEQKIRNRLNHFKQYKKNGQGPVLGVLGCMAERIKEKLLDEEKIIDLIAGPDAYRDLPSLISLSESGQKSANTLLSIEETYADISPVRIDENGVSAFISIMRGCNNLCSYCVVPYTRGRERSRDPQSILREAEEIKNLGYKEITLLGQNVNSYNWANHSNDIELDFAELLTLVAENYPNIRIRFSTSHPRDMSDKVLHTIARHNNICKGIHLPVQSGSTSVLERMKRRYSREDYLKVIASLKQIVPVAAISTDIIAGFCGETEEEHQATLQLMKEVGFDFAFMFKYSERPGTFAAKKFKDDVPEDVKSRRLDEIIALQNILSLESKKKDIGKVVEVLAEGPSKKSSAEFMGRTSQNKVVVFPAGDTKAGDLVNVKIESCSSATLKGFRL
jgi:tRNA-2-methylthio-N6-dimethylallyladenosine synthase